MSVRQCHGVGAKKQSNMTSHYRLPIGFHTLAELNYKGNRLGSL